MLDTISHALQSAISAVTGISPAILAGLALAVEFALRFVKSDKALGLIHGVAGLLRKVSDVVALCAQLVQKVADLSDKILPQNTQPPAIK